MELFARAQAGDLDLDISVGIFFVAHGVACALDHFARQLAHGHRLAHVEDEHVTAPGEGASQEN